MRNPELAHDISPSDVSCSEADFFEGDWRAKLAELEERCGDDARAKVSKMTLLPLSEVKIAKFDSAFLLCQDIALTEYELDIFQKYGDKEAIMLPSLDKLASESHRAFEEMKANQYPHAIMGRIPT